MAGTRRSPFSLATVACLLAGALLPPAPGDGQNLSSIPSSTVSSSFVPPHSEAGNLSSWTTAPSVTTVDGNITVTSNASDLSLPEPLTPTTVGSLNTTKPQSTAGVISSSADILSHPTPTANLVEEGNQNGLGDANPINTTSLVSSSTNFTATETSWSEAAGSTIVPQPPSSTSSILGPTKDRTESTPWTDHEAITEARVRVSTSASDATSGEVILNASSIVTLTPGFISTTLKAVETGHPINHVQESSAADMGNGDEDLPSMSEARAVGEDPLVIAVIFIFTVTVGILALMGFLRYRQHSSRLQFRRLQDLPMDDMMEDTPLSLYSY
ncbi:hypothetical protein JRQ81_014987 [Phrynocephalus forsythii]|uniref:Uncharacterized protein n=1 Tax=Phrynocephalus forsythii TaxID=171643 RepID=A0A9Q1B3C5_9SAUR|nr:hypothetical protein JRQ81_014987 [Phrynocephalus forsythii]